MKLSLWCSFASSLIIGIGWSGSATAEIVPDSTLPQPSRVTQSGNRTVITAGTRRGRNLFHSFREFATPAGETASFQRVDADIANIFARVTGNNHSHINGLIEVLQAENRISSANLFLLNPNGIIFGRNASLRMGGSFIATTADRIAFADGTEFSAVNPQSTPLLTVSVPVGLQFGNQPGSIENRSVVPVQDEAGNPIYDPLIDSSQGAVQLQGLNGTPDHTLALVGGQVTFAEKSGLVSRGGRIEIGSVLGAAQVRLTPIADGWDLSYDGIENFGDIRLFSLARLESSNAASGAIQIQGRRVSVADFARIVPVTSTQRGGAVEITASDLALIRGDVITATQGTGRAGDVNISARQLMIRGGGRVGSVTYDVGRSGDVNVNASESVIVEGVLPGSPGLVSEDLLSLLFVQSSRTGEAGAVGNLNITTNRLQVGSGGQISAATSNMSDAGNITIEADDVALTGIAVDSSGQPLFDSDFPGLPISGGLFVGTARNSGGNGGRLIIRTERLRLQDGAILQATTYGSGDAGNINVQATESVEVSGLSERTRSPARIIATSGGPTDFNRNLARTATGRGGNVNLSTSRLVVRDGGTVAVNSRNPNSAQGAGRIEIRANQIVLDRQAQVSAQTESGENARIELSEVDLLAMRRGSKISTEAGSSTGGGNAGRIDIDANFILNAPAENSDITADADQENAGRIDITAQGILGTAKRDERTFQSDITATSRAGVSGEISISTPTVDPTRGILELPSTVVDASQLIARGCQAETRSVAEQSGEFTITGRGGLPPNPTDLRGSQAVTTEWATHPQQLVSSPVEATRERFNPTGIASSSFAASSAAAPIVEAQGWIVGPNGKVNLVAQTQFLTSQSPHWGSPDCIESVRR